MVVADLDDGGGGEFSIFRNASSNLIPLKSKGSALLPRSFLDEFFLGTVSFSSPPWAFYQLLLYESIVMPIEAIHSDAGTVLQGRHGDYS